MACGILVLWPGIELRPLHWKHQVLTTKLSGKSLSPPWIQKFPNLDSTHLVTNIFPFTVLILVSGIPPCSKLEMRNHWLFAFCSYIQSTRKGCGFCPSMSLTFPASCHALSSSLWVVFSDPPGRLLCPPLCTLSCVFVGCTSELFSRWGDSRYSSLVLF